MSLTSLDLSQLIQSCFNHKKPFCAYKKPKETRVNLIIQQNQSLNKVIKFTESGFIFAPFKDIAETIIFPLELCDKYAFSIPNNAIKSKIDLPVITDIQKKNHLDLVQKTVSFLRNEHASKIVISRKECLTYPDFDLINTFINLLNKYDNALVYLWYHPKIGLWMGATPELLLNIKNNRFTTMALAGTQKNDTNIIWKDKEKQEQQYVTDYITKILEKNNLTYRKSDPYTVNAGSIVHIRTDINGVLSPNFDVKKLIKELHPTPAVCGIPKDIAKDFIEKNENYNREFYTGFLGELNYTSYKNRTKRNIENQAYNNTIKETALFVNLRCMQIKNNQICFYIGGGITKNSHPENELTETIEKAKIIKHHII